LKKSGLLAFGMACFGASVDINVRRVNLSLQGASIVRCLARKGAGSLSPQ
jgi:hypothetical protein